MQVIPLRPQRRHIVSKRIALYVLAALSLFFPALALPLEMLMLLFACPLMKGEKVWIALLPLAVPSVVSAVQHASYIYVAMLLLFVFVPAGIAYFEKPEEMAKSSRPLIYIMVIMVTAVLTLWAMYYDKWCEGISLAEYIATEAEQWLMRHPKRTELLYQALAAGVLPVPEGYQQVTLLNLMLDPVFLGEVRLMLRTRIMQLVESYVPSLLVQGCIIIGLFVHLRILRMWGSFLVADENEPKKVRMALAPAYSIVRVPPQGHALLGLCLLFYMLFWGSDGFLQRLAQVMYYTVEAAYQLQGGAVICERIIRKNADRRVLAGVLVAVLYAFTPIVLFVIGCFNNVFSFRSDAGDDKNEREKNEEEEP
ncbi:MAG: hypothetical protein E7323_07055 [Clostridiales bacterium]|nr:hypothetical protein [Clostridiales bacterium]